MGRFLVHYCSCEEGILDEDNLQILLKATMSQLWTYSFTGASQRWSSMRVSTETRSSTMVIMICSFLMPYPTGTSLAAKGNKCSHQKHKLNAKKCDSLNSVCEIERKHTCAPKQSFHLDTPNSFLELGHVGLIVPWLHIK